MAVLNKKEEKIQAVLGRLPITYTKEAFVQMFIQLFSKDWGKLKKAYIKQSQDKEPDTIVNMPKPELYLQQILEIYLKNNPPVSSAPITAAPNSSEKTKTAKKKPLEEGKPVKPVAIKKVKIETEGLKKNIKKPKKAD